MIDRDDPSELGEQLVESVVDPRVAEVIAEVADASFSSMLSTDILKDIPFFGLFLKITQAVLGIRERVFLKKVAGFLTGASRATAEEKRGFQESINSNPDESRRVGEAVLLLLERLDDFEKSKILGELFAAYVGGRINFFWFQEMAIAVSRCSMSSLRMLMDGKVNTWLATKSRMDGHGPRTLQLDPKDELYRAGFLKMEVKRHVQKNRRVIVGDADETFYVQEFSLNDLAVSLVQILTGKSPARGAWWNKP